MRKEICPECGREVSRDYMDFSHDCHGIPFRLLCLDCIEKIENGRGYDGQYYTELDENIDYDY